MKRYHWFLIFVISCEGLSLNEKNASTDTYLENGAIAVDGITGNAFMLHSIFAQPIAGEQPKIVSKIVYSAHPDSPGVRKVLDLTKYEDVRMLFPKDGILVMAETNGLDELFLLDRLTFAIKKSKKTQSRYNGTRTAPSGRFIAVCDNTQNPCPIHVIQTDTLETVVIPHKGYWLEAMWLNKNDNLLAIVFNEDKIARIVEWSMIEKKIGDLKPDETGYWQDRKLDIEIKGVTPDLLFSFTWVGVSPDDRYAVFPVRKPVKEKKEGEGGVLDFIFQLIILDLEKGEVRTLDHAQGPVGFSPDGSTIVSYRHDWIEEKMDNGQVNIVKKNARILLIDRETLSETELDMPFEAGPQFFITKEGNVILVTSVSYAGFVLYDLDTKKTTELLTEDANLSEFTSRVGHGEIWLVPESPISRVDMIDLEKMVLEEVKLDFIPRHINYLPNQDLLVLDDKNIARFVFFNPEDRTVKNAVNIPEL